MPLPATTPVLPPGAMHKAKLAILTVCSLILTALCGWVVAYGMMVACLVALLWQPRP